MKALTVWQPWASLIAMDAKPYEFRRWSFAHDRRHGQPSLVGQRIVIHAGARVPRLQEVDDILERIAEGTSALVEAIARPALEQLRAAIVTYHQERQAWQAEARFRRQRQRRGPFKDDPVGNMPSEPSPPMILSAGLCTAELGEPIKAIDLFRDQYDSDRIDHAVWAWPLKSVEAFPEPIPARGAQSFWEWRA